jgi:hypothetical protein
MKIVGNEEMIKVKDHVGNWSILDSRLIGGEKMMLLEHNTYGEDAAYLIIDTNGTVIEDIHDWRDYETYLQQGQYKTYFDIHQTGNMFCHRIKNEAEEFRASLERQEFDEIYAQADKVKFYKDFVIATQKKVMRIYDEYQEGLTYEQGRGFHKIANYFISNDEKNDVLERIYNLYSEGMTDLININAKEEYDVFIDKLYETWEENIRGDILSFGWNKPHNIDPNLLWESSQILGSGETWNDGYKYRIINENEFYIFYMGRNEVDIDTYFLGKKHGRNIAVEFEGGYINEVEEKYYQVIAPKDCIVLDNYITYSMQPVRVGEVVLNMLKDGVGLDKISQYTNQDKSTIASIVGELKADGKINVKQLENNSMLPEEIKGDAMEDVPDELEH